MRVDNGGHSTNDQSTPFLVTGTGQLTFDNLNVTNGAWMYTPDNLTVTGTLNVDPSSHLTANNMP